ncbi:arsenate reductase (azurin) large subunit [Methylobacterium nonmethylotrophicum]|uniref:Arsenate reductase (Azurin) large subunit n=1 Tax=Methylobacterium nonmethylotrophicum TaxID=1141884 RepID=A0A4Z0NF41_9HYPH|nr:arsenate reductase (azurin) large subunit [Methylobacterium nonmethylotrophicum]TGD94565.1 arsenate reductase (azurin) large subunit [Methylobacterium nonmethylotrophicum]
MAYKRQIDRLPIVPADAKEHNVVCHYCIVGCGYKAYSWDIDKQGTTAPTGNKFNLDLSKQQGPDTDAWYAPSMYNIVKQDGRDVHLVIKPDKNCVVNSGLGSVRGARMAEMTYSSVRNTEQQRLTDPMVWRYGQMQPTSWDDALDLVARVTAAILANKGEDALFVSAYDHGGAGGGYENTWATGKLYFESLKIKNIRIHNRPAYNSEVHATRDMGVGELNNCYEDAELADTIVVVGANPLETQTNYFLNHWIPNLRGTSLDKKKAEFPNEAVEPGRIVIIDPRRTVTVNACEVEAGADRVMHLQINSGTDLVLFNAWLTYIADKGWTDKAFIGASTKDFDKAVAGNRTSLEEAARITGLTVDQIRQSAEWIAQPKGGGARRRAMFAYEKGLIWGNDNYRTNGALVNVALATGNVGRPGGGCVRLGGHQEGYSRPSDAHVGRPAPYIDQLLINGQGAVHHIWGCDHYKTTLNALQFKNAYKRRTDLVKDAMATVPWGDRQAMVNAILAAIDKGGLFSVDVDIIPTQIGQGSHVWLPAATSGEMNLTSMNGERRMRLTERYMDPPGRSMPDCLIVARLANHMERVLREMGKADLADKFKGYDWKTEEDAFMDGYHRHEKGGEFVTYARLRAMGTNGFQEPAVGLDTTGPVTAGTTTGQTPGMVVQGPTIEARGKEPAQKSEPSAAASTVPVASEGGKIIGTKRLYADGKFNTKDGKAIFMETKWRGLQASGKEEESKKFPFLINNGRANHVWQSAYLDQQNDFVMDRYPWPTIEMNPQDVTRLGLKQGDLVEVYNDNGSTQAIVYPTDRVKERQTFMLFAFPRGVQGNVVSAGVNEFIIPNYKQTWGNIRKLADAPEAVRGLSFKPQDYVAS